MNDFDMESKLKSVPLPERAEEYWENFPSQVRFQLQRERRAFAQPSNVWRLTFLRAGSLAFAAALVFICVQFHPLKTVSQAITKQEMKIHRQFAQLNTGLHVLMLNPHGMGYLLTEAN